MNQCVDTREIERQFLIRDLPEDLHGQPFVNIRQGYLAVSENREIRIRASDAEYSMTIKDGQGVARSETDVALSEEQFNKLWPATGNQHIEKIRYDYCLGDRMVQIDCYQGVLQGFNVLEVEFESLPESESFKPPAFCGEEITEKGSFYYLQKFMQDL